jgi:hypothetical protein
MPEEIPVPKEGITPGELLNRLLRVMRRRQLSRPRQYVFARIVPAH